MKSHKVFRILKSLSKDEFADFRRYLKFKYQGGSAYTIKLIEYLKKFYPEFSNNDTNDEKIFRKLYPLEKYNNKKLRDRYSELVRYAEEYFFMKEIEGSEAYRHLFLLKQYRKRNLNEDVIKLFKTGRNYFESEKANNPEFYYHKFVFYTEFLQFADDYFEFRDVAEVSSKLANYSDNLVYFFMISMLKNYVNIFIKDKFLKFSYSFTFMDFIMGYIESDNKILEHIPLLKIYHDFFTILKSKNGGEKFFNIKSLIVANKTKLPWEIYRELYIALFYYSNTLYTNGHKEFGDECLVLLNDMIQEGILFETDGTIQETSYTSYIAVALRQGKLQAAEKFADEYKNKLNEEVRDDSYNYNKAVICYRKVSLNKLTGKQMKEAYYDALNYLSHVKHNRYIFYIRNTELAIKLHYELGNYTYVSDLLHMYRNGLYRSHNLLLKIRQSSLNFISYTEKLLKIQQHFSRARVTRTRNDIEKCENIIYKSWLLAKLQEIADRSVKYG